MKNEATYSNNWERLKGFTLEEARAKKRKVDEANNANQPDSKWEPAEIVQDLSRIDGYKVVARIKK